MTIDEEALIRGSQQGDLDAFNRLVEAYQRQVYNLCLRMLASPEAAEDATQEAFIAAFRAVGRFRGGSFRAWLLRIAANACYDELRRRRARPALSLDAPRGEGAAAFQVPDPGPLPEERAQRQELARLLQGALSALPPDQRLALILCDLQGLDYAEIAQATGTSLGTVKSRISRARSRLRRLLMERGELLAGFIRPSSGDR